jgi:hypothetical protein
VILTWRLPALAEAPVMLQFEQNTKLYRSYSSRATADVRSAHFW